jgi:hypothetical protein
MRSREGHRHLDEHDLAAQVRRALEQLAVRAQALGNPLRVVEAVDAEEDAAVAVPLAQRFEGALGLGIALDVARELVGGDADGQRLQPGRAALRGHPVQPAGQAQHAQQRGAEVLEVEVGLEGDEVRAEQPAEDLVPVGQDAEGLRGGKRDVQEEAHLGLGGDVADQPRQQHQVVVVDPHRVAGLQVLEHGVAEAPVRGDVGRPAFGIRLEVGREVVEQGPEGLVRVALVEPAGEVRGQVDRHEPVLAARRVEQDLAIDIRFPRRVARPADPEAAAGLEDGVDGAGQPSRAGLGDPALRAAADGERQAVRDDDELSLGHVAPRSLQATYHARAAWGRRPCLSWIQRREGSARGLMRAPNTSTRLET